MAYPSEEDREKRAVESHKLIYDVFKHLTTLSTGAVVLLATLLDKAPRDPGVRWLVGVSMGAFMWSVLCSVAMMFSTATTVVPDDRPRGGKTAALNALIVGAIGAFVAGVLALVVFTISNLWRP